MIGRALLRIAEAQGIQILIAVIAGELSEKCVILEDCQEGSTKISLRSLGEFVGVVTPSLRNGPAMNNRGLAPFFQPDRRLPSQI